MIKTTIQIKKERATPKSADLSQFLLDLDNEDTEELKNWLRFAYMHMQLDRFSREELKSIIGHIAYLTDTKKL